MLLQTDSRRRITLPAAAGLKPGDAVELEVLTDGRMVLTPMVTIPKHQLWAWTPESRDTIAASLSDPRPALPLETQEAVDSVAGRWERED